MNDSGILRIELVMVQFILTCCFIIVPKKRRYFPHDVIFELYTWQSVLCVMETVRIVCRQCYQVYAPFCLSITVACNISGIFDRKYNEVDE